MKLIFHIDYRANWGESLYVSANIPALGNDNHADALLMEVEGDSLWHAEIEIPDGTPAFRYQYLVRNDVADANTEWGDRHLFEPVEGVKEYELYDGWHEQPFNKPFYSRAFTDCIFRHNTETDPHILPAADHVVLHVTAPTVPTEHTLAISGSSDGLGAWNPDKAIRLSCQDFPVWKIALPIDTLDKDVEFKFLIVDSATGAVVSWEEGSNRHLPASMRRGCATVVAGLRYHADERPWKGAGTAIPVFSLRSKADMGVGDFYDLIPLVDWASETGQSVIQILPVNDTTMTGSWSDSYPYNANSINALHPLYLRLEEMGTLKDANRRSYYEKVRAELAALPTLDYERALATKMEYCREIFDQEGDTTLSSKQYKEFVENNKEWLLPYAAYCVLRDKYGSPDFKKWGKQAVYSDTLMRGVCHENAAEIEFVCFLQFHLDRQMRYVHKYASTHRIALKGDIPIGISRNSVDAWANPRLFNIDCQAGAPPDDFAVLGQNWGFPTYNWEEMSLDGFSWWRARFDKMADYFDAYRIDHILGFFRIWEIPMHAVHGLLGHFHPALPFSESELRYKYDYWIDLDLQTTPYIMDYFAEDFFGPYTREALSKFCRKVGGGRYRFRSDFDTQRKVADYFATQPVNDKNTRICNGLLGLHDQVLFIEDPYEKGKYHPRITAQYTYIYRSLNKYEQWCFNRLYNDFYYHRHNELWYEKAMWKLPPLIDSTRMLVCAEDLGMIPSCVPAVMHRLEILSLEIQRMPKDTIAPFGDTTQYPYYSVCTTSTHDMSGIRQWWQEDRVKTQEYFNNVLGQRGTAPFYAEPWICECIIQQHLESPSMLCILPLQDWLSIDSRIRREKPEDERINIPANPHHYWCYRMHLNVEDLLAHKDLTRHIRSKVKESGR